MGISVLNPMEVIKTQIQASRSKTSAADVFARIWRTDGILGLWAGLSLGFSFCYRLVRCIHVASNLKNTTSPCFVFCLSQIASIFLCPFPAESQKYPLPLSFFLPRSYGTSPSRSSNNCSSCSAIFIPKYQFCCIVLIMNASGFHFRYLRNFFSSCGFSCSQLHFRDSPGIGPNIARTFLVCAAELGTYDEVKTHLLKSQRFSDGPLAHVLASASAAFASASISTPVVSAQPFSRTLRWRAAALG